MGAASIKFVLLALLISGCPERRARDSGDAGGAEAALGLPPPSPRGPEFRRGISLGLFASTQDPKEQQAIYTELIDEVRALGATDLQLVVQWYEADVHATSIHPLDGHDAGDALLRWAIDGAHGRGLRVFLLPIVGLLHRAGREWRGTLAPGDWDAWWRSYRAFILHYADLSAEKHVELYAVGSELISTEAQDERWRALISAVRSRYEGQLTYSANWDHFEPVGFFDALDVAGISAYPPLARQARVRDEASLEKGWTPFLQQLHRFAAERRLRYVLTEVGYPSHSEAALRPWDSRPIGAVDLELQARLYRVLFKTWQADPKLAGLFIWNWFGIGGAEDRSYTPRKKPAEQVLLHWYRGTGAERGN